jgi:O-antigen/teichoic acid export membrane protein/aminoglycoside phosphotransferase
VASVNAPSSFGTTTRRLAEHVRTPIYREGYALVLSAGVAAALGFVYWIVAARTYSVDVVGLNSAAISTMMLVSGIAQLNLISALLRFVPGAGVATRRLIGWSYAISAVAAVLVALAFLAGVRRWAPSLASISSDPMFALWFAAAAIVWCIFNLQDAAFTGLRRSIWVPVDNTLFGVVKIGLLVAFAMVSPRLGIFASWTLGALLCVLALNALLVGRLVPEHARKAPTDGGELPSARQIGRFVGADYVGGLSWLVAITVMPIIVTQELGAAQNAYYSLAWVMATPLYLVSASTASSLVVALVNEQSRFREYTQRVFVQTSRLVVPAALVLALAAPLFLRLFGTDYAQRGTTALRLMALSAVPAMVIALYMGVWRAEKRLSLLVWVRCVVYGAVMLLSVVLLPRYGIEGPAFAWLVVQTIAAFAIFAFCPHVVLASATRVPWHLRGLGLVRNAASQTGLLTLSGLVKRRPAMQRCRARAAITVPRILAELPESGPGQPPSAWTVRALLPGVAEKLVVLVGPPGAPPRAVVKLAASDNAARGLARETDILSVLCGDRRLEAWRAMLPRVLAAGEIDSRPFRVEAILPGIQASRAMAGGAVPFDPLADAIAGLHRRTGSELDVDAAIIGAWVDAPLEILEHHARRRGGSPRRQLRGLDRVRDQLHEGLAGRRLTAGWTHGDYVPGNVLVDPATRTVRGVVDWERSGSPNLQAIDLVQLVLAIRALQRGREYGEIVMEALGGRWTEAERGVLARAAEPLDDGLDPSVLVLLAWLRHTQNLLTKADAYADNWLWHRLNFELPLAALA